MLPNKFWKEGAAVMKSLAEFCWRRWILGLIVVATFVVLLGVAFFAGLSTPQRQRVVQRVKSVLERRAAK